MGHSEEHATAIELGYLLHDAPFAYPRREICMDIRTLFRRTKHEGLRFLTVTLANLGKAFVSALSGDRSFQSPSSFTRLRGCAFPRFLGAAFKRVFTDDGYLLPEDQVCHQTIRWLYTFLTYAYKVEVPFTEDQTDVFSENFIRTDAEIGGQNHIHIALSTDLDKIVNLMRHQLYAIFSNYTGEDLVPNFGPGISSDKQRADRWLWPTGLGGSTVAKHFGVQYFGTTYEQYEWSIDPDGPISFVCATLFALTLCCAHEGINGSLCSANQRGRSSEVFTSSFDFYLRSLRSELDPVSKVLFVNKDSRGPRVIACEPSYHMWMQQAVRKAMQHCIERHPRTQGHVNFTDQTINQKLVFDDRYATLDLKDASDRVSLDLVKSVFPPHLLGDMIACRTPDAILPSGTRISLAKFAPMGSALCFPTMAIVIYTACLAGIYLEHGVLPSRNHDVYVYGDDIVLPSEYASAAMNALEVIGLKVNQDKSFIWSRFRESCGVYAVDNHDVTPLRKRKLFRGLKKSKHMGRRVVRDGGWAVSTVDLANRAWALGYTSLAYSLMVQVESVFGRLPLGKPQSGYLCWHTDLDPEQIWEKDSKELRAWFVFDGSINLNHNDESSVRASISSAGSSEPDSWKKTGMRDPFYALTGVAKWWLPVYTPKKKYWRGMLVEGI